MGLYCIRFHFRILSEFESSSHVACMICKLEDLSFQACGKSTQQRVSAFPRASFRILLS